MKKKPKALYLKMEIDGYQEDQIVGHSLAQTHKSVKVADNFDWPEDKAALLKALKLVHHYYTGKTLK